MSDMSALVTRLEAVADRLEKAGAGGGGGGDAGGDVGASIGAFDELLTGSLQKLLEMTSGLGAEASEVGPLVQAAFAAQREFLVVVSQSQKPAASDFPALLSATSTAMGAVSSFKEKNFKSKQMNHLTGLAELVGVLGWVAMDKPCPFIKETLGSAQFYTNRVIKEFKETDKAQVEWARGVTTVMNDLHDYVKQHHTTGPSWNAGGVKAAAPAAPKLAPVVVKKAAAPTADVKGALFGALNKGGGVTSGLKKVDKSEMTHKNPALRGSSVVPAVVKKAPAPAKVFGAPSVKKDPVLELNGKKWAVEYQENNKNIVIDTDGQTNQVLYVFKCTGSTIQVKGKINAITLDGCKKCAIVFDTCVAAFELINCQSVQVQVIERVKTISVDKTDGCQVYLSKECLDAEIISAKSSEMNVSLPIGENDEFVEMALPEQYKTVYNPVTKKIDTEPTDIAA